MSVLHWSGFKNLKMFWHQWGCVAANYACYQMYITWTSWKRNCIFVHLFFINSSESWISCKPTPDLGRPHLQCVHILTRSVCHLSLDVLTPGSLASYSPFCFFFLQSHSHYQMCLCEVLIPSHRLLFSFLHRNLLWRGGGANGWKWRVKLVQKASFGRR